MKKDDKNTKVLNQREKMNKTPLLDEYIQRQWQDTKFKNIDNEEIAKAIRMLLHKDDTLPKNLN